MSGESNALPVHRCRFVEWVPSAVRAMAFNHATNRLAVARDNADIEIWECGAKWRIERIIPGHEDWDVRGVTWCGGRLFSAGLNGVLVEWDQVALTPKEVVEVGGNGVWCVSASHAQDRIVLGANSGGASVVRVDDDLDVQCVLPVQKGRTLCACWSQNDSRIFVGGSDGTIRAFTSTGRPVLSIQLGKVNKKVPVVWSLATLFDDSIVSGSSFGKTQIWDSRHGTLVQSIHSHTSEVSSIVVRNNASFFASGPDNKIVLFSLTTFSDGDVVGKAGAQQAPTEWVYSLHMRPHTHDVRAMELCGAHLASGGLDTAVCVVEAELFGRGTRIRKLFPYPQFPTVWCGYERPVVVSQHTHHVDVFGLPAVPGAVHGPTGSVVAQASHTHLLRIKTHTGNNVMCCAINTDASLVAIADVTALRIHHLKYDSQGKPQVHGVKLRAPVVYAMAFAHNALWAATATGKLIVLNVEIGPDGVGNSAEITHTLQHSPNPEAVAGIVRVVASADGQWVVSADTAHNIAVFNARTKKLHHRLPPPSAVPTALCVHPSKGLLVLVHLDLTITVLDLHTREETEWSKQYGQKLPPYMTTHAGLVTGCSFVPDSMLLTIHSTTFVGVLDLEKSPSPHNMPPPDLFVPHDAPAAPPTKKRRLDNVAGGPSQPVVQPSAQNTAHNTTGLLVHRFRPVVFQGVVKDALVVVERPWADVMEHMPAPLFKKRFGMM